MPELLASTAAVDSRPEAQRGAAIGSLAMAVPPRAVGNGPIAERLGVSERWIVERTGVVERRVADPEEVLPAYAAAAGERALQGAGCESRDIDLVLVATMSHEKLTPNAAPLVAAELGASGAGAVDVGAACTGFLSGIALGAGQIECGRSERVLVVGADLLSRLTDRDDRGTAGLFGDGAGAVVLQPSESPGRIGPVVLGADGARGGLVEAERAEGLIHMKGPDTFRQAVDRLSEATLAAASTARVELADVDLFAYHQANSRIIRAVGERLELPAERVIDCVPSYGNTSAASIPIALAVARERGLLGAGSRVLCAAFGGGLTWGATAIEWGPDGS